MKHYTLALALRLSGSIAASLASHAEPLPLSLKAAVAALLPGVTDEAITPSPIPDRFSVFRGSLANCIPK